MFFPNCFFKMIFHLMVKQMKTYFGEVGMEKGANSLIPVWLPLHQWASFPAGMETREHSSWNECWQTLGLKQMQRCVSDDAITILDVHLSHIGHWELLCPFSITCYLLERIFVLNFSALRNEISYLPRNKRLNLDEGGARERRWWAEGCFCIKIELM